MLRTFLLRFIRSAGLCFGLARAAERVALPGHVLTALAQATPTKSVALSPPMALTIVLRRSDPAGFDRYLAELYDPSSPEFRHYKSARQVSDLFGPSTADYAAVRGYFTGNGFSVIEDSANRMTLTVLGSREAIQQSLAVDIANYTAASPDGSVREFFANADEPKLPADIAAKVHSIAGLSNLALPQRPTTVRQDDLIRVFPNNDAIVVATCTVSSYLSLYLNEAGRIKICNDCAAPKMSSKSNTTPCGKPPAGRLLGESGLAVDMRPHAGESCGLKGHRRQFAELARPRWRGTAHRPPRIRSLRRRPMSSTISSCSVFRPR